MLKCQPGKMLRLKFAEITLGWTWRVNLPFFEGPTYVWKQIYYFQSDFEVKIWTRKVKVGQKTGRFSALKLIQMDWKLLWDVPEGSLPCLETTNTKKNRKLPENWQNIF